MSDLKVVSFDTETGGLDWFDPSQQAFMATWSTATQNHCATIDEPKSIDKFLKVLAGADVLIAHNAKFDCHQVRETWGFDILTDSKAEIHDTDIISRVLFPEGQRKGSRGGHGLKNLAKVWLKEDAGAAEDKIKELGKSIGLRTIKQTGAYYKVWRAYPEAMARYAMDDTRFTYDIWKLFMEKWGDADPRLLGIYEMEREVLPILIRAEARGVTVHPERVKKLRTKYRRAANKYHKELVAELGVAAVDGPDALDEWDGDEDTPTSKAEALREALQMIGVPLHRKTPTGVLSTNKFALQEFEDEFPILAVLREWRTASKFLATYIDPMSDRLVVHTSFNQVAAWTGRMSCSRPNMQNLPKGEKGVRSVFLPRKGHSFVVCDYASIEAFLLAYYLGDEEYRRRVAEDDPHAWMASMIHHGNGDRMAEYLKETDGAKKREDAKNTTYAICYGAGAPRVSDMNQITKEAAKVLISKVKGSLPGFYRLNKRIRRKIESSGFVNTYFGRKQVVNKDKAYVGLNALIQGTAADIMKRGMVLAQRAYDANGLDAHILLIVHDELLTECPTPIAKKVLALTIEAMEEACRGIEPQIRVDGKAVTTNYGDAK